jgi:NADPH:quinone reductase-like Zn-dependent oxidoreductase
LNPITVCSPHNFDLAKSYGATAVFDYKQPSCIEDIWKHTRNSLKYVLDCVSEPETMEFCYKCFGRTGGKYSALEPYPELFHTRPRTVGQSRLHDNKMKSLETLASIGSLLFKNCWMRVS